MEDKQLQEIQELVNTLKQLRDHLVQAIIRLDERVPTDRMAQFTEILKKPLAIDDKRTVEALRRFEDQVQKVQNMDIARISSELKFIGGKIHTIDERLRMIERNGVPARLEVNVSMNGKEMIKKPNQFDYLDPCEDDEDDRYINELMQLLDARERKVVTMRFGLDGQGERTYKEIGKHFNISPTRARDIHLHARRIWTHKNNLPILIRIKDPKFRSVVGPYIWTDQASS